ncbi:uncharacterized protein IAS62_000831 [Cryptococcus decagattii]|uniref:Cell division control protein 14 n=1 Tax=Cryptococcus decagattii TaxID=1859122 RepID=A0ABZ2ALW9_9TREE
MRTSHRKSHSTSALSLLAHSSTLAPPTSLKQNISRQHLDRFKRGQNVLPSDNEQSSNPGFGDALKKGRSEGDARELLDDLKSLRSSSRRRMAALKAVEKFLVEACVGLQFDALEKFLSFNPYEALVSLLTRHTSTLSHRSSHIPLPADDEMALSLIPELTLVVGILQGLCLMSRRCKEFVGEGWVMEVFIDLLLLLRTQPPSHESDRPISYNVLELLFCVLVDSPENARRFEKLSGLEAVVRVLKGSSVGKDVRMKCIEFLYFYLLPEQQDSNTDERNVSNSSVSSTTLSELYPPSPPTLSRTKPPITITTSAVNTSDVPKSNATADKLGDIDVPFIPQTPVKRPRPNLGYLTPATRQVSGVSANTSSSTPGLPTVPASPSSPAVSSTIVPPSPREPKGGMMSSASSTGLARMLDEDVLSSPVAGARIPARLKHRDDSVSGKVGLGIGPPNLDMTGATSKTRGGTSNDPFNLTVSSKRSNSGTSGSSTVVPSTASLAISESSTRPPWVVLRGGKRSGEARVSARLGRSASLRREVSPSPSPLASSSFPTAHASHLEKERDGEGQTQRQRGGSSGLAMVSGIPRSSTSPRSRHSRAQSHASGLSLRPPIGSSESASVPSIDIPPVPGLPGSVPANLTKGMVPSASSPGLSAIAATSFNLSSSVEEVRKKGREVPLGATKVVLSRNYGDIRGRERDESDGETVTGAKAGLRGQAKTATKTVEEKKEMLGMWLGNVEQLVQGVEKVSFWGSVGGARKRR